MFSQTIFKRYLGIVFIILLLILIGIASRSYQGGIISALLLFTLFRKPNNYLIEKLGLGKNISATLMMLSSVFIIIIPLSVILVVLATAIINIINQNLGVLTEISQIDNLDSLPFIDNQIINGLTFRDVFNNFNIAETVQSVASNVSNFLVKFVQNFGQASADLAVNLIIMFFIFFYMLRDSDKLFEVAKKYSPFRRENTVKLLENFETMTYANVLGTGLVAVVQGIAATIGYLIFGVENPFLWGLVTGLFAFVPVIGTTAVWLPAGVIMMLTKDPVWLGIGVLLWGGLVVTWIDNVVRIASNKWVGDIHPLISLLGVFIGLPLFGMLGIIIGPSILSLALLAIKMFREEYVTV